MSAEPETRRVPADWSFTALHAAGAQSIAEIREDGELVGLEVRPPVSDEAYLAAFATTGQDALKVYAADRRWQHEQAGTTWNGWPIHTDAASQSKYLSELQAIALNVRIDGDPWKFADGVFRPVSNEDFPALAIAARAHVRAAFGVEGMVLAGIEAGTISTREQIDAAAWPANL